MTWISATTSGLQMAANTGYVANNNSTGVAFVLPATPTFADRVQVAGLSSWSVLPNANQSIVQDIAGAGAVSGGGLSGGLGSAVTLLYVGNNTFMLTAYVGKINTVSSDIFAHNGILWTPPDISHTYTWSQASSMCASASYGGLTGWRLPTAGELVAIDVFGVKGTHGWPNNTMNMWASDPGPSTPDTYAVEAFGFGVTGYQFGSNDLVSTCVR